MATTKPTGIADAWSAMEAGKGLMAKLPGVLDVLDVLSCRYNAHSKTWFFRAVCLVEGSRFVMGEVEKDNRIDEVVIEFASDGVLKAVKVGSLARKPMAEKVL